MITVDTRRRRRFTRSPAVPATTAEPSVRTPPRTSIALFSRALPNLFPRWRAEFPPFGRRCRPMRSRISRSRAHPESHASLMNGN